ncbi:MAG: GTPase ObgE [Smithellaceae bacterium]|jgi:GTP-binding protein|nr:GTPase ObgE [Smithellaceae bacterium]MDD3259879.1 GTPase ObgE [Smithellaceae bacterium]MDD3849658.1 GTPase ObgE [Smithellaceae bacterium]
MRFVDEAKIFVRGGHGGAGAVSFRREKFVPRGGPDGGNGGNGGDVILCASNSHHTLLDLKYQQHHFAKNGGHGSGNNRTGSSAENLTVVVPPGTLVKDFETGEVLADLATVGQTFVAARGGIGGKGNAHFKTSTHQTPRFAQEGMEGEERTLLLELKLLADVGLLGFPNAGKSTFISRVSAARPKIADYPFTTLVPHLGVVKYKDAPSFVVADIPGLIAGASAGLGMGISFLRHVERTALLVHLIDIAEETRTDAWKNFTAISKELAGFNPQLLEKPQIVCLNKIDLPFVREKLKKTVAQFSKKGIMLHPFSAATGEGVQEILQKIVTVLNQAKNDDHE